MLKKVNWKWLIIGLVIGYFVHVSLSHPKSPVVNLYNRGGA